MTRSVEVLAFSKSYSLITRRVEVPSFSKSNTDARGFWRLVELKFLHSRRVIRMQEGFDSYRARALKYFFLPCDPAGKIISSYNYKVYRSESKFICMNELCVNISLGALTNERFWCRLNFKKNVKHIFFENFTLPNENYEKNVAPSIFCSSQENSNGNLQSRQGSRHPTFTLWAEIGTRLQAPSDFLFDFITSYIV